MYRFFQSCLLLLACYSVPAFSEYSPNWLEIKDSKALTAIQILQLAEKRHQGIICGIESKWQPALIYVVDLCNLRKEPIEQISYQGIDGKIIGNSHHIAQPQSVTAAVKTLVKRHLPLPILLEEIQGLDHALVVSAKLDSDLGIHYLEVTLLNQQGLQSLVFDIKERKMLPLLI